MPEGAGVLVHAVFELGAYLTGFVIRGLWIGAGVTFLLNAGCFGLVILTLSHTSFR